MDKKTPMLDPKKKNEQKIEDQDSQGDPNSRPDTPKEPTKEEPEKVPESNDPAGYSEPDNIKESPYKKK
ncbi:hypothetical protein Aeqsu_1641 [Aequorivita sublithincola DSM 14238]|uniref:Uncharacterized protein n=1 Tax=Aequorivita sublithincola (strain DSM 14238 / LMG 21431 / ACAM 643 / 9-3) TaxID=746697 RepID=I3YVV7_AEQSU|nr:hypothetical protein [Aequorivita sublithincola]AFL81125.1 hypothetical protein Aeqsu_1641 [Aequorivita sublithincola DSM 14238]